MLDESTNHGADEVITATELARRFIDALLADGFANGAVLAGTHSAALAAIATAMGPEQAAMICERTADCLRQAVKGGLHARQH